MREDGMNWRKSSHSYSNGNCAEVASWRKSTYSGSAGECIETASWRKSTYSSSGACAEAGNGPGVVGVRDTEQEHLGEARTVLRFSPAAWREFTARIKES